MLQPLEDVSFMKGHRARLECIVTGDPQPEVTWLRDGKAIAFDPRYK